MKSAAVLFLVTLMPWFVGCGRVFHTDAKVTIEKGPLLVRRGNSLDVIYSDAIPRDLGNVRSVAELALELNVSSKTANELWPQGPTKFSGPIEISSPTERIQLTAEAGALRPVTIKAASKPNHLSEPAPPVTAPAGQEPRRP